MLFYPALRSASFELRQELFGPLYPDPIFQMWLVGLAAWLQQFEPKNTQGKAHLDKLFGIGM